VTNQEKWNFIVSEYKTLYHEREEVIDNRWRQYCNTLFGYQPLFNEIVTQLSIQVGVHDHAIPDILLRKDDTDIFDIELKKYSLSFDEKFNKQRISYLKLQTLSVGMIACKEIYLYSYEITKKITKKIRIPFVEDNPLGIKLVELLQKDTFSADAIHEFVNSELEKEQRKKEIRKKLTPELIKESVIASLKAEYTDEEIADVLDGASFSIHLKNKPSQLAKAPITSSPWIPTPVSDDLDSFYLHVSDVILRWCEETPSVNICAESSTGTAYRRFTTSAMDAFIPEQFGAKSGWRNGHFYFYEIRNIKKTGAFKMQFALSNTNTPAAILDQYEKLFDFFHAHPTKADWQWRLLFSTESFRYTADTSDAEIIAALEAQLGYMLSQEAGFLNSLLSV
jgi:hypothetical protein